MLNGARIFGEWACCWNSQIASALLFVCPLLLLPAWWACAIAVLSGIIGLFSRFRQLALLVMTCCLIFITTYYVSAYFSSMVRRSNYIAAAVRGTEIVKAIFQYQEDHGAPPANLQQLSPAYIKGIPDTGLAVAPHFEYHFYGKNAPQWELTLQQSDLPNADTLVYWPGANYPAYLPEGTIEKLGQWAFVHDNSF